MKKTFPGYYRPSAKELASMWDTGIFVLDANVLLNLYRYTPDTAEELLGILKAISDRIWVPHQAALEYHRNRLNVIAQQREAYAEIHDFLQKSRNQIEGKLNAYLRHPYVDVRSILQDIDNAFEKIDRHLEERKKSHPDLFDKDNLRNEITKIFDGKVGALYTPEELRAVYKEGEERYKRSIPPGYSDARDKPGDEKYGDLVLWLQVIDKAREAQNPVILVTDDVKEDWWWRFGGKIVSPQPQLVDEMLTKAKCAFYMYRSDQFMEYAREHLKRKVDQQAIDEVRKVREQYEQTKMQLYMLQELEMTNRELEELEHRNEELMSRVRQIEKDIEIKSVSLKNQDSSDHERDIMELRNLEQLWMKLTHELELSQMQAVKVKKHIAQLRDRRNFLQHRVKQSQLVE
jgi:hypothetical protein